MKTELSLKEKIFYTLSIITGIILLACVTPSLKLFHTDGTGKTSLDLHLVIFCLSGVILCYILHFRKMALWIIGVKFKSNTSANTRWIMDDVIAYAALFIAGTSAASWIVALASFLFQVFMLTDALIRRRKAGIKQKKEGKSLPPFPWWQVLYAFTNPFNKILIIVQSGLLYQYLYKDSKPLISPDNLTAAFAMLIVYFSLSTLISSITIVLRQDKKISMLWSEFKEHYADINIYILMLFPLGYLIALMYTHEPLGLLLIPLPLIAMHKAMKNIEIIFDEYKEFLYSLAYAIDARDHYTYGHSERVALYSKAIARHMQLPEKQIDEIEKAGKIHDLGKIIIPDNILHKPGKLDENEYAIMKTHINALQAHFENKKRLSSALPIEIASSHHERFDGTGYVIGKSGLSIPLGGRILAIADVFDALTTDRPYRKGMKAETALSYIKDGKGSHFDPRIVDVFEDMHNKGILVKLMEESMERTGEK